MANAVYGKQDAVSPADETGKQRRIVFEAAIVMQEAAVRSFHQRLHTRRLVCAASDVEHALVIQVDGVIWLVVLAGEQNRKLPLHGGNLVTQGVALPLGKITRALSLCPSGVNGAKPRFQPLASAHFFGKPLLSISERHLQGLSIAVDVDDGHVIGSLAGKRVIE